MSNVLCLIAAFPQNFGFEVQVGKIRHNNEKGVGLFLHQQASTERRAQARERGNSASA
jgi:hypothetical protein